MPSIKELLLDRLLNDWLEDWKKEKTPSRFVDKWGNRVPEHWCKVLEEKVSDYWLDNLLDTRKAFKKFSEKKYHELARKLKNKYYWVDSMSVGKIWTPHANEGKITQVTITFEVFLSEAINILLMKTHQQWDESDLESLYLIIRLKIEALIDDLIPNVYKAELHGRKQPQSWEDFLHQAVELLLAGKRQWNQENNPDIYKQIEVVVDSLVSAVSEQHKVVKALYSDNGDYDPSELEQIADSVLVENVGKELELDYISGFQDDDELIWFANRLPEFIEINNPYMHRINVTFVPNYIIAEQLELDEKKVRELKKRLKIKLQPYRKLLG